MYSVQRSAEQKFSNAFMTVHVSEFFADLSSQQLLAVIRET